MSDKPIILSVEDDPGIREQIVWSFDKYHVETAQDRSDAITKLRRFEPAVVLLDLGLPPDSGGVTEGLETLKEIMKLAPATKVIMVTGVDDKEVAVKSIQMGAYDFYMKPIDVDVLSLIVDRAYYLHGLEKAHQNLWQFENASQVQGIITSSAAMLKICRTIEKIAPTNVSTMLLGESGTGKEVIAKAIHHISDRKSKPFVAINCAAIPENLLESELFGHEKGAFTGAVKQTLGKIEMANGGTLFLDEIGDLPLSLQPKLLRFLQERVVERLGGRKEIPVDVRLICATHQNLEEKIKDQSFREDLYYRISEMAIRIPPLRERATDAVLLSRIFLNRFAKEHSRPVKSFTQEALTHIERYSWPGNVRELENRIKRSVIMADGSQVTSEDLELPLVEMEMMPFNLKEVRENAEREAIIKALNYTGNNFSRASEILGITRPTLYNLIEKLEIKEIA